jgi:hypothetical protein
MINERRLAIVFFSSVLAAIPPAPSAAQDATFPCKVLLCGQTNLPTIPYCVPIMQQAIWMQMLGVAVGICQQAIGQARQPAQNQSAARSPLAANSSNTSTNPILCPSEPFPVSQTAGGYTINTGGSMCGTPLSPAVQNVIAFKCSNYTDETCSVLFTPADLKVTNPPAPAQSGAAAGQ